MKTKVIILHTPELRDDLNYMKYCNAEELSYNLRKIPLDINIETELECVKNQAISQSVDGKIISITSKLIPNPADFVPLEEVTIKYI